MAINVQDKAGNATITASGTVTSVTDPVYVGPKALQFNSSADDSVSDGNGKISFTIPSGIGTGVFTIQAFISINSDDSTHTGNHHSDYFIDVGGIQVRVKTQTSSGELRISPSNLGYGSFRAATNTQASPNEYFHFRITRDSSNAVKFWEGLPGATGGLEHVLSNSDTTNMDGQTIEIGDLGTGGGAFRLDAFEIKDTYSENTSTSYIIPSNDSTAEDIESDTLVLIDGTATTTFEGDASLSASTSLTVGANRIVGVATSPSSTASVSVTANELIQASATLSINAVTENYIESTYIEEGYFKDLKANVFSPAVASLSASGSVSCSAGVIRDASVSLGIDVFVGDENYVEEGYIELGYFERTVLAEEVVVTIDLTISTTLTVTAEETADATLQILSSIGEEYVRGSDYTEPLYFADGIEAERFRVGASTLSSQVTVTPDADLTADGIANLSSTGTVSVDADLEATGEVSVSISASTSVVGITALVGSVTTAISSTVGVTAVAELAGEISVSIAATTSIQANATSSGDIQPSITVTLTCSAEAFKINDRYTLIIPKETRVNTITEETRSVQIPKETRELEFLI